VLIESLAQISSATGVEVPVRLRLEHIDVVHPISRAERVRPRMYRSVAVAFRESAPHRVVLAA
jgi:hypothetical protein